MSANVTLQADPDPQALADQLSDDVRAMRRHAGIVLPQSLRPSIRADSESIIVEVPERVDLFAEVHRQLLAETDGTYDVAGVDFETQRVYYQPRGLMEANN